MADYEAVTTEEKKDTTSDEAILKESRDALEKCIEDEHEQREKMLDDLRFATLDQWPADLRAQRENDVVNGPRPCLTVDQVNQYITQVSNDMAANRPSIKTRPVDDQADPETAKIFQGLVRHIEDQSSAHIAYQTSGDSAVTIGLGFLRIVSQRIEGTFNDQELLIKRVPDTFSVYLGDRSPSIMPDGSDADKAWVFEKIPLEKFKRDYPGKKIDDADFAGLPLLPVWKTDKDIIVCEYFYRQYTPTKILFLEDGRSVYEDEYESMPEPKPLKTNERDELKISIKWCKHSGCEILDKRDLPGKYIPIVEEVGKEKIVDGKRVLWGLVRPAKDSLRAFNYWISAMTEKMALSPKAPFIGAVGQFATEQEKWNKANVNNYAWLGYDAVDVNGNAVPPPKRQEPMQMEPAMAQMLALMQNNVKSSLGMYKASVGDTDSQQSGRAILALKKESDTGTAHFGENQAIAVAHCGRILVDLIPHYYDTKRVLRILGEDGKVQSASIDPELEGPKQQIHDTNGRVIKTIYNLGVGKYDVTVTTGPGYTTSRQEAATVMTELANSAKDPISAAIMRYAAVKNSDFHGSEEVTNMLKAMLPPQVMPPEEGQEPIPPRAMQKIMAMQQQGQQLQQAMQELSQENQQLKSGAQTDMAKVQADHDAKMKAVQLDKLVEEEKARVAQEKFEFEKKLEIEKANHEIDLNERKALAAQKEKEGKIAFDQKCHEDDMKFKRDEQAIAASGSALPQIETMVDDMKAELSVLPQLPQALSAMQQTLEKMLDVLTNPPKRKVDISGIQKGPDGRISGATVSTTIQ